MSSIDIDSQRIWNNLEQRILRILSLALEMMREETDLDIVEDKLNRKLYFYILKANRVFYSQGEGMDWPPYCEAQNQPDADDEE